jgi:hypothetical protein
MSTDIPTRTSASHHSWRDYAVHLPDVNHYVAEKIMKAPKELVDAFEQHNALVARYHEAVLTRDEADSASRATPDDEQAISAAIREGADPAVAADEAARRRADALRATIAAQAIVGGYRAPMLESAWRAMQAVDMHRDAFVPALAEVVEAQAAEVERARAALHAAERRYAETAELERWFEQTHATAGETFPHTHYVKRAQG